MSACPGMTATSEVIIESIPPHNDQEGLNPAPQPGSPKGTAPLPLYALDAVLEKEGRTVVYRLLMAKLRKQRSIWANATITTSLSKMASSPTIALPYTTRRYWAMKSAARLRAGTSPLGICRMNLRETAALSIVGLTSHKLRTLLTMLGIIYVWLP